MLIDKLHSQYKVYQEKRQEREKFQNSINEALSPSKQEEYKQRRITARNLYLIGILSVLISIGVVISGILALENVSVFVMIGELIFSVSPVSKQLTALVIIISPIIPLICSQFVLMMAINQSEAIRQIEQKID